MSQETEKQTDTHTLFARGIFPTPEGLQDKVPTLSLASRALTSLSPASLP